MKSRTRITFRGLEMLERRDTPAVTIVNPTTATYVDADSDFVTVRVSEGTLTAARFTFGVGAAGEQLQRLDLSSPEFEHASLTITARRGRFGDGRVDVGFVDATDQDLGAVVIAGDLGRLVAGKEDSTETSKVRSLSVRSLGRNGLDTQGGSGNLMSIVDGDLGSLKVFGDIARATVNVIGSIGSATIGGSIFGGLMDDARANEGSIAAGWILGPVKVRGDIQGGIGDFSGTIRASNSLASVTVGGSLIGGSGANSGEIYSRSGMGRVSIGRNIRGGSSTNSGQVLSNGDLVGVIVGGSLIGASGPQSGGVRCTGRLGPVTIKRDVIGGSGYLSGAIQGAQTSVRITIDGSLIGGTGTFSGSLKCANDLGSVVIGGDVVGGSIAGNESDLTSSGAISVLGRIGTMTIGGSIVAGTDTSTDGQLIKNASILAGRDIGSLLIGGSLVGNSTCSLQITAFGQDNPRPGTDVAIGNIHVAGRVEYTHILAGYDSDGAPRNADAQIGVVTVGGDWIASDLVAGAVDGGDGFGNLDDARMSGEFVRDLAETSSKIARVTIGGFAIGTPSDPNLADRFGIVAQEIGAVTANGRKFKLTAGAANDRLSLYVGPASDFCVLEIG